MAVSLNPNEPYLVVVYVRNQGIAHQKTYRELKPAKEQALAAANTLNDAQKDFHVFVTDVTVSPPETLMEIFTGPGRVGPERPN